MTERLLRTCDTCEVEDTLPHHVETIVNLGLTLSRHKECCAGQGCEICIVELASASVEPPAAWR